jgi:FkbM family methyltransferase
MVLDFCFKHNFKLRVTENIKIYNFLHEATEQALIAKYIHPTDCVLDIGGNIGASSIIINKLTNKKFLVVEPSPYYVKILKKNRQDHQANFDILEGVLSKPRDLYLHQISILTHVNETPTKTKVKTYDFNELHKKYKFNVVVADCEGSFEQIVRDFPNIFDDMRLVMFEKDGECDYTYITNLLIKKHFQIKFYSFHDVWERKI